MKKTVSTLLLAGAVTAAPVAMADFDRIRWQVPMAFSSSLTALGDTMPLVSEMVSNVSDGRVTLQAFEPGKLVPPLSIFDNVSSGNIPAGYSWMGYEWGQIPASALFGATPFGLESQEFLAWMNHHGGQELLEELYEPYNVHPILCGTISPESAGWFTEEMASVDDFKGLKFRAAGLGGEIMSEFGMSVNVLPGGELYQALETGVLDATEFSLPIIDKQLGFYQVAKHYYLPGWHQPSTNQYLYVNLDKWNDLNAQTQALIETACMAGNAAAIAKAEALQGAALNEFEELGVNLHQYDQAVLEEFEAATERVMQKYSEQDEMFAKVYASMKEFQEEHALWKSYGYLPRDYHLQD